MENNRFYRQLIRLFKQQTDILPNVWETLLDGLSAYDGCSLESLRDNDVYVLLSLYQDGLVDYTIRLLDEKGITQDYLSGINNTLSHKDPMAHATFCGYLDVHHNIHYVSSIREAITLYFSDFIFKHQGRRIISEIRDFINISFLWKYSRHPSEFWVKTYSHFYTSLGHVQIQKLVELSIQSKLR